MPGWLVYRRSDAAVTADPYDLIRADPVQTYALGFDQAVTLARLMSGPEIIAEWAHTKRPRVEART